ncbi:hypothetical protein [Kitasatospora sp. NPDC097643]|uniref:RNA polymerase sigma factor n=1 Tax=Kitasatospora sp. NPDC097643 TaxID=3157230 RepID=UPI003324BEF2
MRTRVRAGDRGVFGQLFDTYARAVYNHVFRLTGDWSAAEAVPPTTVEYYEQPGGRHKTVDFEKLIPMALEWLTKNLTGPQSDS